jgi:hypothetical protein
MLNARGNAASLNRSASIENAAGERAASPTPTAVRARKSCVKLRDRPHRAVIRLQVAMPATMMRRRLARSTRRPIGMPRKV